MTRDALRVLSRDLRRLAEPARAAQPSTALERVFARRQEEPRLEKSPGTRAKFQVSFRSVPARKPRRIALVIVSRSILARRGCRRVKSVVRCIKNAYRDKARH